ncbi:MULTISPECIES: SDR family oxidoreductase [unclassified Frondihabitans]|uniref:SDR family oxidoreductase n=1 Tax=unclassified Frondihabitans TaxID=2626248 RepID=UPI000F4E0212|nr:MULTISPECIES: SDR family oxidoreductase [unclassified Frondihabitans]RPE76405.1 short-subunit dehydrogenase [Frondihabitans sp. PhB153]RPF05319.1 short-subunit dehydrogenase [Frondihabitans sp. PhB161]
MSNKIAVVTGGTAGLGRAIVRELAERGWDVAILARGEDGLDGAAADVRSTGRRALSISVDVADNDAVEAAAERIEGELGEIDLWVNDAMVGVFGEFLTTDPGDFERATHVNYFGFVNGTRAALKRMVPRDRGHVIQIGSALAHRGIPLQAAYCASKHAITGFTESVTTELIHNKSHVKISQVDMPAMNTIQFNWVKSQLPDHPQPVPTIFQPETCARAVADVAERPRRRSWIGEPTVMTVLGNRFVASFLDVYLAKTGYSGQQAPEKSEPMLPTNLYEPVAGDHGSRGIFSDKAKESSPQIWYTQHRTVSYAAAIGAAAAGLTALVAGVKARK